MITSANFHTISLNDITTNVSPDHTITYEPRKASVAMDNNYRIYFSGEQKKLTPEQLLALLCNTPKETAITYGSDGSLTFVNTEAEFEYNGETLTLVLQPNIFKVPAHVVHGLEYYFDIQDLHAHVQDSHEALQA